LFVTVHLNGAKSGKRFGIMLNTAPSAAAELVAQSSLLKKHHRDFAEIDFKK